MKLRWNSIVPEIIRGAIERWRIESRSPNGQALIEMLSKEWVVLLQGEQRLFLSQCEKVLKDWAKRNGYQFGHSGTHNGKCGKGEHHHHDKMCESPWESLRVLEIPNE